MATPSAVPCDYEGCGYAATEQCDRCHGAFCLRHSRRRGGAGVIGDATCLTCLPSWAVAVDGRVPCPKCGRLNSVYRVTCKACRAARWSPPRWARRGGARPVPRPGGAGAAARAGRAPGPTPAALTAPGGVAGAYRVRVAPGGTARAAGARRAPSRPRPPPRARSPRGTRPASSLTAAARASAARVLRRRRATGRRGRGQPGRRGWCSPARRGRRPWRSAAAPPRQ